MADCERSEVFLDQWPIDCSLRLSDFGIVCSETDGQAFSHVEG